MDGKSNKSIDIELLMSIKKQCEYSKETVLEYYCDCLIKICRAYNKIENTQMLFYVKQIMSPTLPLVLKYFADTVNLYQKTKSDLERERIQQDIEDSIVSFDDVFESIIHSTNGADRILLQTAPIDTGLRHAAPKLCAFYSMALNTLADIFNKGQGEEYDKYAFCVYPSLNTQAEAIPLFSTMEKRGKVGIIRVPGKDIADIDYIKVLLSHEFFHIVPAELRLRGERARLYLRVLLQDLEGAFSEEFLKLNDKEERERLRHILFDNIIEDFKKDFSNKKENDRCFYSRKMMNYYVCKLIIQLRNIQKKETGLLFEEIYQKKDYQDYEDYKNSMETVKELHNMLDDKICKMFAGKMIERKCEFYRTIFREIYADLLAILALRIEPEEYCSAFKYVPNDEKCGLVRVGLYLRVFLVKKTMKNPILHRLSKSEYFISKWERYDELEKQTAFIKDINDFFMDVSKGRNKEAVFDGNKMVEDEGGQPIFLSLKIFSEYSDYLDKCLEKYLSFEKEHEREFDEFRDRFKALGTRDDSERMYKIGKRDWEIH